MMYISILGHRIQILPAHADTCRRFLHDPEMKRLTSSSLSSDGGSTKTTALAAAVLAGVPHAPHDLRQESAVELRRDLVGDLAPEPGVVRA